MLWVVIFLIYALTALVFGIENLRVKAMRKSDGRTHPIPNMN